MTSLEKAEIKRLPKRYKPLGAWSYFWYNVLFSIPVVGFIALIICSVSSKNIVRRSYARSFFVVLILSLVIVGIVVALALLNVIDFKAIMDSVTTNLPNET